MIAYDCDGVFVPDLMYIEDHFEKLLYFRHNHMHPIFEPEGEYYIITGRPVQDKPHTEKWISTFFKNPPVKLFHDGDDFMKAKEYKLSVLLNHPEITHYIESEPEQVEFLSANTKIKVSLFSDLIRIAVQ